MKGQRGRKQERNDKSGGPVQEVHGQGTGFPEGKNGEREGE